MKFWNAYFIICVSSNNAYLIQENVKTKHPQLLYESKLYKILQGGSNDLYCYYLVPFDFFANSGAHLLDIYWSAIFSYYGSWNSECEMVWR